MTPDRTTCSVPTGRRANRRRTRFLAAVAAVLLMASVGGWAGAPAVAAATPLTIVSLTFDDGNADQLAAEQVMKAHGLVGTFYITTGWIGSSGWLTRANLQTIAADGNEIGGHTVTHPDLTTVSSATASAEICNGRTTLTSWGYAVTDFAYPFAAENSAVEKLVKNCGYTSARNLGDIRSPASCRSCPYAETIPPANAYNTAAPDEVDSTWTLKNLQDLVTNAESHGGGWVQLTFHHIANSGDPTLTITPALFEQFVTWLSARTANGTTVVRTVAQALGTTSVPPANTPPTAAFSGPGTGITGIPVAFNGSGSFDPDGSVTSYSWAFGDGTPAMTGAQATHTFATTGTYPVTLTVTDNQGATGIVTHQIVVSAPAGPSAPGAPTGVTGTAGNGSATVSWTAPANGGSAITTYTVIPYDGTTALTPLTVQAPATSTGVSGLTNGTAYTFRVSATNAVGTSPPSAASAPVTPTAPPSVVVTNGGFETGLTGWATAGVTSPRTVTARAHTGKGSALLGVTGGREPLGDSSLAQAIVVPATGGAMLTFWYQPHSDDRTCGSGKACTRDWMEAQIRTSGGATLVSVLKLNNDRGSWTKVTADLSAYRGQSVTVWFNVHLNGPNPNDDTWMYLDDVAVG